MPYPFPSPTLAVLSMPIAAYSTSGSHRCLRMFANFCNGDIQPGCSADQFVHFIPIEVGYPGPQLFTKGDANVIHLSPLLSIAACEAMNHHGSQTPIEDTP